MSIEGHLPAWLDQYASNFHHWRSARHLEQDVFYRPLGLVEYAFDADGTYYEGRSDVSVSLKFEIRTVVSQKQFRERILLAWTAFRLSHLLLLARAVDRQVYMSQEAETTRNRFFAVHQPTNAGDAISDAGGHLIFTEDLYDEIDEHEIYEHSKNVARVINPEQTMAKLLVLPSKPKCGNRTSLRLLLLASHQITDGLTNVMWTIHFKKLLNSRLSDLRKMIEVLATPQSIRSKLPLPQEDLYPLVSGSLARRRWFWVLTVVLRHVRRPLPAAFSNPLRRKGPLRTVVTPAPIFEKIFDYSRAPPLNSFTVTANIPTRGTQRMHRLCREARVSIGAGSFALVAVSMMEMYENQEPEVLPHDRLPFIAGFPINPRPFFNHKEEPNSLMLAFSDGVVLPFLPSTLDLDGRIRLLARSAQKQLALYQKRKTRPEDSDLLAYMSSRGAGRVIAMNYIAAVERIEAKLPPHLRKGINPQGELAVRPNATAQTCGVSSLGRQNPLLAPGIYDLDAPLRAGEDAFVADFKHMWQNVRARDNEFLVGIAGNLEGIRASVSYDGNAIDRDMAEEWKRKIEGLLVHEKAKL